MPRCCNTNPLQADIGLPPRSLVDSACPPACPHTARVFTTAAIRCLRELVGVLTTQPLLSPLPSPCAVHDLPAGVISFNNGLLFCKGVEAPCPDMACSFPVIFVLLFERRLVEDEVRNLRSDLQRGAYLYAFAVFETTVFTAYVGPNPLLSKRH